MPMPVPPSGPIRTKADRKRWRAHQDWMQEQQRAFNASFREEARKEAEAHRQQMRKEQPVNVTLVLSRKDVALLEKVLDAGRRAIAPRYHPDANGGDGEEMRRINNMTDAIRKKLREARSPSE